MDVIDQAFSGMYFEYVLTITLCRATPYETVYVADYGHTPEYLELLKKAARRSALIYGEKSVRLRKVTFEDQVEHEHFTQRAYRDMEKLEDYTSDHGVTEDGGYI